MFPFLLLAVSMLPAQQVSMDCADTGVNIATTQTQPVRGPAGSSAVFNVSSSDDYAKDSHLCEADYQLLITSAPGTAPTKALEKDRKLRYQNAADIRTDLQRLKRDSDRMAVEAAGAGVKPARKSTRWAVTGATILVIGLAVGGWLFFSRKAHALTDKDTIVLALGVYFSAAAGSYAIGNLFPHLYMPFLRYLLPLFGVWLPSAWAYTFTKVPNDARLATATLRAGFPWLQR